MKELVKNNIAFLHRMNYMLTLNTGIKKVVIKLKQPQLKAISVNILLNYLETIMETQK